MEETKCYCGHTNCCDCGPLEELKQETLKDKKFQQKLVDKLNNGELSYQNAPIYTILLDLVQGNSVDEVYRVFCEVIKEQNNNKYSEEEAEKNPKN